MESEDISGGASADADGTAGHLAEDAGMTDEEFEAAAGEEEGPGEAAATPRPAD